VTNGKFGKHPDPETAHANTPVLTDGVVILKRRTVADVEAQLVSQDSEIVKWMDWDEPTLENVTEMIAANAHSWNATMGDAILESTMRHLLYLLETRLPISLTRCLRSIRSTLDMRFSLRGAVPASPHVQSSCSVIGLSTVRPFGNPF
jgi:hypothetical protein